MISLSVKGVFWDITSQNLRVKQGHYYRKDNLILNLNLDEFSEKLRSILDSTSRNWDRTRHQFDKIRWNFWTVHDDFFNKISCILGMYKSKLGQYKTIFGQCKSNWDSTR